MKRTVEGTAFYMGGLLGTVTVRWNDGIKRPSSTHMFCPHCGLLWGAVIVPLSDRHHVLTIPCGAHGGGVFHRFSDYKQQFEIAFDRKIMEHDFLLMCDWLERPPLEDPGVVGGVVDWPMDVGSHKKSIGL